MYSITIFNTPRYWAEKERYVYDNKTHRRLEVDSWDQLVNVLRKLSKRKLKGKMDAELISPAIYVPETSRSNRNVLAWAGWAAIDVDDHVFEGDLEQSFKEKFGTYDYVIYSTASSKPDHPKFRVVFRLDRHVDKDEIKHFWFALNNEIDSLGDKQTKDLSRMYFVPGDYEDAYNFFYVNSGREINVKAMLEKHPYVDKTAKSFLDRLPEALRKSVIEHRKSSLDDTGIRWSSYLDCPFVSKKILKDWNSIAGVDGTGRYGMMYKIMVSIAGSAIARGYPLTATQLEELIRQIDADTSRKYENRPIDVEAQNALEYAYKNSY